MNYLTFIVASIRNKPGRNLATVFCFAFIAANVFSAQYLISGASGSFDQGVLRMGADLMVVPYQYQWFFKGSGPQNTVALVKVDPVTFRFSSGAMDPMKNINNISKMSPQLYVAKLDVPDLSASPVDIYGIDPATDFTIRPWLQQPLDGTLGCRGDHCRECDTCREIIPLLPLRSRLYGSGKAGSNAVFR